MAISTSDLITFAIVSYQPSNDDDHQPLHQVLEIQERFIHYLMGPSTSQILYQTLPISLNGDNNLHFHLPLYLFRGHEPISFQIYIAQLLSFHGIDSYASQIIAREIALTVNHITNENQDTRFHLVVVIEYAQLIWMDLSSFPMLLQPERNNVRMERLEENGEDLGDCSICLEELCCDRRDVVRILCGHVFHESCIKRWLCNSHFCPLCRRPILPNED